VLPMRADWNPTTYLEPRMRVFRAALLSFPANDPAWRDLPGHLFVGLVPAEARMVIEVENQSPEEAARLANDLVGRLEAWVEEFNETQSGEDRVRVRTLVSATVPAAPSGPRYQLNTVAGAVLGVLLGLPLAFLWDALDDTLGDPERAAAHLGIVVWPALPPFPADRVPLREEPAGEVAAAFHRLHSQLRLTSATPWHTLAVVGPAADDLPPALLADLGAAIAQEGVTVLLVDAGFDRPALHEPLGLPPSPGLGTFLQQDAPGQPVPVETGIKGLRVLPAGEPLPPTAQAVALQRVAGVLPDLASTAEVVLVRLPDAQAHPEALLLAAQADAVLLTGRTGRTRGREVRRALAGLRQVRANVLGLVLWQKRFGG